MNKTAEMPLSWQVAEKIRILIRKNELASGERLSEQKLCDQLGVSRTPLREALRMLSSEGLVTISPNKGACVAQVSIEDVFYMFETMSILEGSCARLAAERITDADLAEMERLHGQLEKMYSCNDPDGFMRFNQNYHKFVQEKAGNPILSKIVSGLRDMVLLHRYRQIYYPGRLDASMEEHRGLMEAFRAREGERAERLMKTHLIKQCQALVAFYAEQGQSINSER